ncbi:MAG: DUF2236 domain-containing protein [Bacteroidota bacterium]|nr:DUF2236 domain-containing protein [Bacteroidota bacterium]
MHKLQFYQEEFLSKKRLEADILGDQTVEGLMSDHEKNFLKIIFSQVNVNNKELPSGLPDFAIQYFNQTAKMPDWADTSKMARGAAFFSKYSTQILFVLGFYSLPYCYAAANGAMVLHLTQRITDEPGKRFLDTSQFVLDVMAPNAFEGRGKGIRSAQKVRLIHAIARNYIQKGGKWNYNWGMPVNQEDMAGTNLAFSLISLRGLRKLGIQVSPSEASSFMHLWNVIGFILGISEDLLPDTNKEAFILDKMISKRQFKASVAGEKLTASLIEYMKSTSPPGLPGELIYTYMRHFLGDPVSDILSIPNVPGSPVFLTPLQGINRINSIFGLNPGNYFQTQHLVRMQKNKL